MLEHSIHYIASYEDAGTPVESPFKNVTYTNDVSAGHPKHEYSTGYAWNII